MKLLVASTVLALSASAFAAPDSSINDLQYLPDAGTIFGSTQFAHAKFDQGKGNALFQAVGYSVANNLFLDLGLAYSHIDAGSNEFKGMNDIAVNGRYRLNTTANRFDLVGGITVSPGKSEVDGDEGNTFTGGHTVKVGAEYGNKTAERQWSVGAYYTYLLESKEEDKVQDETYDSDAHGQLGFAANLLTRIHENCFFKTFGSVDFESKYDSESSSGDTETAAQTQWQLGGEFQHLISKDLYINAGVTAQLDGDSSEGASMLYNIGANYQF